MTYRGMVDATCRSAEVSRGSGPLDELAFIKLVTMEATSSGVLEPASGVEEVCCGFDLDSNK